MSEQWKENCINLYTAIEEMIESKLNTSVIFRPYLGGLEDAMKEAKEYNSIMEMLNGICNEHNYRTPWFTITPEELYIEKQKSGDERVGWHNLFYLTYERPSKIKNIEGYKKYFGISNDDVVFGEDFPTGVIGMFSTDYEKNGLEILEHFLKTGEEFDPNKKIYKTGSNNCKSELMEVIETLAYEVAKYKYPDQHEYSKEQIKGIMLCAGLDKKYLGE